MSFLFFISFFKGDLLCNFLFNKVFEHWCMSTVCVDNQTINGKNPPTLLFFIIPINQKRCLKTHGFRFPVGISPAHDWWINITNIVFVKSLQRSSASEPWRTLWMNLIYGRNYGEELYICANHFLPDCFVNKGQFNTGFTQKLILKDGSIPAVHAQTSYPE